MIKFSHTRGEYGCFSNFTKAKIEIDGLEFTSSEAAWQAFKTTDITERKLFCNMTPAAAKRAGRRLKLRADWEKVKYQLMVEVLRAKFNQHEKMREKLLSTGDEELVEDTTGWHDNIWGDCSCEKCKQVVGKNLLGKALMQVREELRNKK